MRLAKSMRRIAWPAIVFRVLLAQDDEQVTIIPDHRALEAALPHMLHRLVPLVRTPGLGHRHGCRMRPGDWPGPGRSSRWKWFAISQ